MKTKPLALLVFIVLTGLGPATWGTTYFVTTQFLPANSPLWAAAGRALPIGVLLVVFFRRLPTGQWWWRIVVLGLLNFGFFFALLFVAAYRLPGGVAATIGAIQPLLVALFAWRLLQERPTVKQIGVGLLGVVGVGLLLLKADARLDPPGILAALGATGSMALGTVLIKRWGRPAPLLVFTAWQLVAGSIFLIPLAFITEGPLPPLTGTNIIGFVYLGLIATGLAYTLWFRGIERLPVSAVSFLALLSPVVATLIGFFLLHQGLSPLQLVGTVLALISVVGGQLAAQKRKTSLPAGDLPARSGHRQATFQKAHSIHRSRVKRSLKHVSAYCGHLL